MLFKSLPYMAGGTRYFATFFLKVLIPTFYINLIQFLGSFVISQMINNGLSQVLILEDDVRFEPNFRNQLRGLLMEATTLSSRYRWELM